MLHTRSWSVLILACSCLATAGAESVPAAPATPAVAPAAAPTPAANEDSYVAQGVLPKGVDSTGLTGQAFFFAVDKHAGAPGATAPVVVGAEGLVIATDAHHVPGQVMITEVVLQSPTLAPWWSIAWPDGRFTIGKPLKRDDAIRVHGILVSAEDGKPLPYVHVYGDSAGAIIGRSDAQGHFECWVDKTQTQAHLLPFEADLVGHSRFIDATTYDDKDVTFPVEHGVRVRFHVVDAAGKPLSGAQVIWTGGASYQGLTDQGGDVAIGMVSRATPHKPFVMLAGYMPVQCGAIIAGDYVDKPFVITMTAIPAAVVAPTPAVAPAPTAPSPAPAPALAPAH